MSIEKSLYEVSWKVTEEEYRKDGALSYSTLAKYEREGFNNLNKLFDKVESPSLLFGSAVDALLTGGEEEFNSRFVVIYDETPVQESIAKIVKALFNKFNEEYTSLENIPDLDIIRFAEMFEYQSNWKPETKIKVIREKGNNYYSNLLKAKDKTILDSSTYRDIIATANSIKNSPNTSFYFNYSEDESIEHLYQLKFKESLNGITYRCMFDVLIVDHQTKTIQPIDLKTSSKKEWDFYKSFIEWNYQIQNRLYVRILQKCLSKDEYFKTFKILPYKDVVISKYSLNPLVWDCDFTFAVGTLTFGKNNQIVMRDPEEIGKELYYYLTSRPIVPNEINTLEGNDLRKWINKL